MVVGFQCGTVYRINRLVHLFNSETLRAACHGYQIQILVNTSVSTMYRMHRNGDTNFEFFELENCSILSEEN